MLQARVTTHSCIILFVNLDCLICLSCEQSAATLVETALEDACLAVQRPWLNCGLNLLKVVASFPVPEIHAAIVT